MSRLPDLSLRETLILAPLALVIFWVGLYPRPLIGTMDVSVSAVVQKMKDMAPVKLSHLP